MEVKKKNKKTSRRDFLRLAGQSTLAAAVLSNVTGSILAQESKEVTGEQKTTEKTKEVKKMGRLVKHDRAMPYEIKEGKLPLWICACGLSKKKPYCDGSHKRCTEEQSNELYIYDEKSRIKIPTEY